MLQFGTSAKPQPVLIQDNTTVPPMTSKTSTAFVDHPSEWHTTGTVTPVGKFTDATSLLIFHSISTTIDKKQESDTLTQRNHQI